MALPSPISFLLSAVVVIVGCAADDGDRSRSARGDTLDAVAPWEYERMYWQVRTVLGDRARDSYLGTDTMRVLAWKKSMSRPDSGERRLYTALVWYTHRLVDQGRQTWALALVDSDRQSDGSFGRWRGSAMDDGFDLRSGDVAVFDRRPGNSDIYALTDDSTYNEFFVPVYAPVSDGVKIPEAIVSGVIRRRTWLSVIGEPPKREFLSFAPTATE